MLLERPGNQEVTKVGGTKPVLNDFCVSPNADTTRPTQTSNYIWLI